MAKTSPFQGGHETKELDQETQERPGKQKPKQNSELSEEEPVAPPASQNQAFGSLSSPVANVCKVCNWEGKSLLQHIKND